MCIQLKHNTQFSVFETAEKKRIFKTLVEN